MRHIVGSLLCGWLALAGCAAARDPGAPAANDGAGAGATTTTATTSTGQGGDDRPNPGVGGAGGAGASGAGASGTGASSGGGAAPPGCDHPPVNDPSADPSGLPPGPVVKLTLRVYYMKAPPDDTIVDPIALPGAPGSWVVPLGYKVVLDVTQKNADNHECAWEAEPSYAFSDPSCAFERLGTGNPFLAQLRALTPGAMDVSVALDGVDSNSITLVVE